MLRAAQQNCHTESNRMVVPELCKAQRLADAIYVEERASLEVSPAKSY